MAPGTFNSNIPGVPAVAADATAQGPGSNGVHAFTSSGVDSAVYGEHRATGVGVFGRGGPDGGEGVFGQTASGSSGVYGKNTNTLATVQDYVPTDTNRGLTGESAAGTGVVGISGLAGVPGSIPVRGGAGVVGANDQALGTGVRGQANGDTGTGVYGQADSSDSFGVLGFSYFGTGVRGVSIDGAAVDALTLGVGVSAFNAANRFAADLATPSFAGDFTGPVFVNGMITKSGGGFRIDHPVDPAGKYLLHSFVESPDMKNIYDGIAVLDTEGEADVELPSWFDALNSDFRYQLTCIGAYAPVYVAQEVTGNRFRIGGGAPGMRISWQVTGIRQDAWAVANRVPVEEEKLGDEKGYFLDPRLYGASDERHIRYVRYAAQGQDSKRVEDLARIRRSGESYRQRR